MTFSDIFISMARKRGQPIGLECAAQRVKGAPSMIKLYKSSCHPRHWIAYAPGTGWLIFPAQSNGWEQRQPARGLDPMHLREVPVPLASASGLPLPSAPSHLQAA
jgi:hypothetical protein